MSTAYERAEGIIRERRDQVERLAQGLLHYETLSGDEITRLMKGEEIETLRPSSGPPVPAPEVRPTPAPSSQGKLAGEPNPDEGPGDLAGEAGLSPA